jgi:L-cysteine:1D-myo-inositol 2-amino-2-deoxy-alpha-D-glucopyranoside ligase
VGLVGLDGTKMSKSLGNLVFVGELLEDWQPVDIRTALLAHHYRQDWEWNSDDMPNAAGRLESWRKAAGHPGPAVAAGDTDPALEAVRRALDDDLDTPGALAALDELADSGQPVDRGAELLGITL